MDTLPDYTTRCCGLNCAEREACQRYISMFTDQAHDKSGYAITRKIQLTMRKIGEECENKRPID